MPFSFVLPTTSSFSFSSSFGCESHPSLPLNASTYRGVVRDTLKKHKRLPPSSQAPNLSSVAASLTSYLPYLIAVDAGLSNRLLQGERITITAKDALAIEWRPTITDNLVPGKESARVKIRSLDEEISFVLSTLANTYTLQARNALRPLYVTSTAPVGTQERHTAVTTATRHLLDAASIHDYLSSRQTTSATTTCADIAPATITAQRALALAEAHFLAVLKDDPYPAAAAQDRNANDREWMFKAPDIPKVRAHLFARVCLEAAEHAARALSLCQGVRAAGGSGSSRGISEDFLRYAEDVRRTGRAKACRFFGIDAELGGETGKAIGWLHAGLQELGVAVAKEGKARGGGGLAGLGRLKKEWAEKREDRKVEKGSDWGADAGRLEEIRVIELLEGKWTKQNDTINTQLIAETGPLLAQMPSGREVYTIKPYQPPVLDAAVLEAMRAPPDRPDDAGDLVDSDDEATLTDAGPAGTYPGTGNEYRSSSVTYY